MEVICDDLKNMPSRIQGSKVDMILCNPPYFKVDSHSNLNESEHYLLARHEITTNLQEICRSAQSILKSNGRLAMVHRPDRLLDILDMLQRHNLAPKRLQFVYPKREKEANMLLIEAIKDGSKSLRPSPKTMTFSGFKPRCSTTFSTPVALEPEIGTISDEC